MNELYDKIVLFILTFLSVYFLYYLLYVRKFKKSSKSKMPMELQLLVNWYKLDLKKANSKKVMEKIAKIVALDVSIVVTIVSIIENPLLQMLLGFFILIQIKKIQKKEMKELKN